MKLPDRYWEGKGLLELGVPWLTPKSIDFIGKNLKKTDRVLELGGGGSTAWFSSLCDSVICWESSMEWRKRIAAVLSNRKNVIFASDVLHLLRTSAGLFNVVLVDSDGAKTNRQTLGELAFRCVAHRGLFILDNYGRYKTSFIRGCSTWLFDDPHWSGKGTLVARRI